MFFYLRPWLSRELRVGVPIRRSWAQIPLHSMFSIFNFLPGVLLNSDIFSHEHHRDLHLSHWSVRLCIVGFESLLVAELGVFECGLQRSFPSDVVLLFLRS